MMDGELSVESEKGKGSNFWFSIRVDKGKEEEHGPEYGNRLQELNQPHFLLIDDNSESLKVIEKTLASYQLTFDSTSDQIEGINFLNDEKRNMMQFWWMPNFRYCGI
jgi:hypothetical protein